MAERITTEYEYGPLIKAARLKRGWSQKELALALEEITGRPIREGRVSEWECDLQTPTPGWMERLGAVLRFQFVIPPEL